MFKDLIKTDLYPTSWCPGCGIGQIAIQLAMVMDELGLDHKNSTLVSGVGCTGRLPEYFNIDGTYTLHGRTLPFAEAVKMVNPELNVIVVSGDGDTTGIGGNHLVHVSRRNANLTVICNSNQVYGLTGGQASPMTPRGTKTTSTPAGSQFDPVNVQGLMLANTKYFYARTTIYHQVHFRNCIKEAIDWPGFAFIDLVCNCIENNGRRLGFNSAYEMLQYYRKTYKKAPDGSQILEPYEIGIVKKD